MKIETVKQAEEAVSGDARLACMSWQTGGRDLALEFEFPGQATRKRARLRCTWARDLHIDLDWRRMMPDADSVIEIGGMALTWEAQYSKLRNGCWRLMFDLPPHGFIQLECNELFFEEI